MNTEKRRRQENVELQSFVLQELDDQDVWFAGSEEIFWVRENLRMPILVIWSDKKASPINPKTTCILFRNQGF